MCVRRAVCYKKICMYVIARVIVSMIVSVIVSVIASVIVSVIARVIARVIVIVHYYILSISAVSVSISS